MSKKLLKDFIPNNLAYEKFYNLEVEGIAYNSKNIEKNYIFFAIKGIKSDGHCYIESAVENGAICVVYQSLYEIDEIIKKHENICFIKTDNIRHFLAQFSGKFFDDPTKYMQIVGVTGTNGKTTTTYLIREILKSHNKKSTLIGTINNIVGDTVIETNLTTPESLEMQSIFYTSKTEGIRHAVMEASSHALDFSRCEYINYDAIIFTNITEEHLDHHKTIENYLGAKLKAFNLLKESSKEKKTAMINKHTDYYEKICEHITNLGLNIVTYGLDQSSDYYAEIVSLDIKSIEYKLFIRGNFIKNVSLSLLGDFNVLNSLSALAYANEYELDINRSIDAIKNIQVPGRFEIVTENCHNFIVAVDYSHTPDSLKNILMAARALKPNKVLVVFGCGGDRDRLKRPIMASVAATYSDKAYLTLDNQRTEQVEQIMSDIEHGFEGKSFNYVKILDRKLAIETAVNEATENDIIIIAGKGHETYQIFPDRTIHFDDREEARIALSKRFS